MKEQIIQKIDGYITSIDEGLKLYIEEKQKRAHGGEDARITMQSCKNMLKELRKFVEEQ